MSLRSGWPQASTDTLSEILYAAGRADRVLLTWEQGELEGKFGRSDADGVLIHTLDSAPLPWRGAPVCLEYPGASGTKTLYSEVLESGPQEIKVRLPSASHPSDRRRSRRVELPLEAGYTFDTSSLDEAFRFLVRDLSTGGISFEDSGQAPLEIGALVEGHLHRSGGDRIPACLRLVRMGLSQGKLLFGAQFTAISIRDQGRIAEIVAEWVALQHHAHQSGAGLGERAVGEGVG